MATTNFGAASASQKRVWASQLFMHGRDEMFFKASGLMGSSKNSCCQRITELSEDERGARAVIQMVPDITNDGVAGDTRLTGNEAQLYADTQEIQLDQLRNGVRSSGRMNEQRTVIRTRETAKEHLSFWVGARYDDLCFLTVSGVAYTENLDGSTRASSTFPSLAFAADVSAPSTNRIRYAGDATSLATIEAGDTMSWDFLLGIKAYARRQRLRPVRSGGRGYYCVVMSPEQARDLKRDADYQANVGRAGVRGDENPLFKDVIAVIDGLVLKEHERVYNVLGATSGTDMWGAGSNIAGAQALLLGAQALGFAEIGSPEFEEADDTDYGNQPGWAIGRIIGLKKPQFQSPYNANAREDFGVISIYTAAAAT